MVRTSLGAEFTANVDVRGAEDVVTVNADTSTSVTSGGIAKDIVRPPDGFVFVLLSLRVSVKPPTGATTGNHEIILLPEGEFIRSIRASSDHTADIEIKSNTILTANANQLPSSEITQARMLRGLRASPTTGFAIQYVNNTDADQTQTRQIRLWLRRIEVERQ